MAGLRMTLGTSAGDYGRATRPSQHWDDDRMESQRVRQYEEERHYTRLRQMTDEALRDAQSRMTTMQRAWEQQYDNGDELIHGGQRDCGEPAFNQARMGTMGFLAGSQPVQAMKSGVMHKVPELLAEADTVLSNPPETWKQYLAKKDYAGIVKMEGMELITALEKGKDMKAVKKELIHTIAALLQALEQ